MVRLGLRFHDVGANELDECMPLSLKFGIWLIGFMALVSCASKNVPSNPDDACDIFEEHEDWYDAMASTRAKYGIPISAQLAIIRQESSFRHQARPPKTYFLFIPTGRVSSAYGYAQALDGTWEDYQKATGNWGADRDDMDDASDFIGWYTRKTARLHNIGMRDVRSHYIAYYVGHAGYGRGKWKNNAWLKNTANKVQNQADRYYRQLLQCENQFR
ncbi:MAG: hypothetical protein ACON5C_10175 [Alphaproteobacteria bacterium]